MKVRFTILAGQVFATAAVSLLAIHLSGGGRAVLAILALGGFWLGLVVAGCIGNYPIPVVGYGASPVIGWIVALALVARHSAAATIPSPSLAAP